MMMVVVVQLQLGCRQVPAHTQTDTHALWTLDRHYQVTECDTV